MSTPYTQTSLTNELLLRALEPLRQWYDRHDIEEIAINRPEELYIKEIGKGWQVSPNKDISFKRIMYLCRMLANVTDQAFDVNGLPILAATLPGGHRFQAVVGPNVRYDMSDTQGVAICIRRFNKERKFSLDDFALRAGEKTVETAYDPDKAKKRYSEFPFEDLVASVQKGEAILVSGATATGKTTFLNALIDYIPRKARIVTVEDTREVVVPHGNRVHFVVSRTTGINKIDYSHILDTVVRMTPDVIVCGEVSITNSKSLYRLMTTGHANFMATIHADSPEMALKAFWQNLTQTDPNLDMMAALEILSRSFGRIVQIDRKDGKRVITAVAAPTLIKRTMNNPEMLAKIAQAS
jgi:type IV secretion system protein VirB11